MQEPGLPSRVVRFDVFEIDLRAGELRKEGRRVKLQEQPFRVLSLLVEGGGGVVTREELREKLWPADTFVDFDHGLNSAVARLREALRDSADKPRFIETVAKRGYRFISQIDATPTAIAAAASPVAAPVVDRTWVREHPRTLAWIAGVPLVAFLCTIALWALYRKRAAGP